MSLTIRSNQLSSIANRALTTANMAQERALQRLSTGQVAPSARYDAAGLAVSSRIRGEVASLKTYVNNATQGVALLQTAEGAYQRVQDMLNRMRSLASQAQGGNLSATERGMLDTEYQQIKLEITRLTKGTTFAGQALFETGNISFQDSGQSGVTGVIMQKQDVFDINGDGKDDLVYINGNNNVMARLGNGDGTYASTATTIITATSISDFALDDMDGDGKKDLILVRANNIQIWRGNGSGGYTLSTDIAGAPDIRGSIITGDFNGDGRKDFGYTETVFGNRVVMQMSNAAGGYTAQNITGIGLQGINAADMDNDGDLDIVAFDTPNTEIELWSNNGAGIFSQTAVYNGGQTFGIGVGQQGRQIIDMNNDGRLDIVVGEDSRGAVHIIDLINGIDTDIDFGINYILDFKVSDFNGDGRIDIAVLDYDNGQIIFGSGNSAYQFTYSTVSFGNGTSGLNLFLSDANNDGKKDIIWQEDGVPVMRVMYNTSIVGMESVTRVSSNAGASNNVAWRAAATTLNSLDLELGYSMITSKGAALRAEASIKNGLNNLLLNRTRVAAAVNRLEKVMDNVATMIENQEGARSAIADVDIAQEMSAFVANQVTLQAGISMLAQANQTPKLLIELFNRGGGA